MALETLPPRIFQGFAAPRKPCFLRKNLPFCEALNLSTTSVINSTIKTNLKEARYDLLTDVGMEKGK